MLKTVQITAKGFTMVELLVVVSIIAIMTGALIPSFSAYTRNQELRQAQEQIVNDLYNVQNNAMSGKKGNNSSSVVTHWGLKFVANSSDYVYLTRATSQTLAESCTNPVEERKANLGDDIVSHGTGCVFFSLGNGDATGTTEFFVKRGSAGADCYQVTVNSAGLIKRIPKSTPCQ